MKLSVTFGLIALLFSASVYAASSEKLADAEACKIRQFDVKVIGNLVAQGMTEERIDELADETEMPADRLDRIHRWVHEALEFNAKGNLSAWAQSHYEQCE